MSTAKVAEHEELFAFAAEGRRLPFAPPAVWHSVTGEARLIFAVTKPAGDKTAIHARAAKLFLRAPGRNFDLDLRLHGQGGSRKHALGIRAR